MKFALALLAGSAAALELPSTFSYADWTTNHLYSREASAKGFNRLRFLQSTPLYDMNGYAAGTPDTFTTSNMAWYGGCHLRPGKLYEDYMNFSIAAGAGVQYADVAGVTRSFRNKRISGSVQYICRNVTGLATGSATECLASAYITGFNWDGLTATTQATGVELKLYQPNVQITTPTATVTAAHPWLYGLDENCLPQKQADGQVPAVMTAMSVSPAPTSFLTNLFTSGTGANVQEINGKFFEQNFIAKTVAPTTGATNTDDGSDGGVNGRLEEVSVILDPIVPDPTFTTPVFGAAPVVGSNNQAGMPRSFLDFYQRPSIGCCKLQRWNKRTYMRSTEKVRTTYDRLCSANNSESSLGTAVRSLTNHLYTCT